MAEDSDRLRERCRGALHRARGRTRVLTDAPDAELTAQHSTLMSPLVWDLAHIGNQEDRWLVRAAGGGAPTVARSGAAPEEIDDLYDAFQHPRSTRPQLPILGPSDARSYTDRVRDGALDVLESTRFDAQRLTDAGFVFGMIAQHEQQHDETMLATHQLRAGPPLLDAPPPPRADPGGRDPGGGEVLVPGGVFTMGTDGAVDGQAAAWALDNERPAHTVDVPAFAIETAPVSNRRYAAFIADGGYEREKLWSERGWQHRLETGLSAPQFWLRGPRGWQRRRFGIVEDLPPDEPVMHVCFFEAEAFAAWAGKRLPTEAEWEKAARYEPSTGRSRTYPWGEAEPTEHRANLGQRHLAPAEVGAYPHGASASGVHHMLGDVWEWTSSGFHGYPGFEAYPYREYSEVFFGGDFRVLRGGSFGTDAVACRGTFRNWDHPTRRQIFSGIRMVRDAAVAGSGAAAAGDADSDAAGGAA